MEGTVFPTGLSDVRVIETFAWDGKRFPRLAAHMARAAATCARLGFPFERMDVLVALDALPHRGPARVRVTIGAAGDVQVTEAALEPTPARWRVALSGQRLASGDPWLQVKTTRRGLYDAARAALPAGIDEMLFANERGELCEGAITSVFFDVGEGLCTPPAVCGLLPGILRSALLEQGACREAVLQASDLSAARLWVGNSLRGMIEAVLVDLPT